MRRTPTAAPRRPGISSSPALREIYTAPTLAVAEARFEAFAAEFGDRYPAVIKLWRTSWPPFSSQP
ncbi:transposase [Micromonospora lutea]|uniref:transposase n=1 Tax=Micromonospora lutea TaxID=419825 RepID=UPI001EF36532|nr:transposase [Micromonospora lutea]